MNTDYVERRCPSADAIYCVGRRSTYCNVDLGGRDDWRTKLSWSLTWL